MFLAGIQIHEGVVLLELTRRVRNAGCDGTAEKLERAWADYDQTVPLETDDREALPRKRGA